MLNCCNESVACLWERAPGLEVGQAPRSDEVSTVESTSWRLILVVETLILTGVGVSEICDAELPGLCCPRPRWGREADRRRDLAAAGVLDRAPDAHFALKPRNLGPD